MYSQAIAAIDGQQYEVGASGSTLYLSSGDSRDWAKHIGIKYAYIAELRDTGRFGFLLPAKFIVDTAKEAREAAFVLARIINSGA